MPYAVYAIENFDKETSKLDALDEQILRKTFSQLKENPFVGDAIRYKFFREKRLREKRIYYLIYEEFSLVLLVAFSGKKAQQETIDEIVKLLPEYKKYAEQLYKNSN